MKWLTSKPLFWVLLICIGVSFTAANRYRWRGEAALEILAADGVGYYSYLPATFIYDDPTFEYYKEINKKYRNRDDWGHFMTMLDGKMLNKYYYGESILVAPFFFIAHGVAHVANLDTDGYSKPYQIAVVAAAVFWVMLGLYWLYAFLIHFVSRRTAAISVGLLYGGTNLFYYTIFEPSASHPYSFALIAGFIHFGYQSIQRKSHASYWKVALILALTIVVRPSNALIVLALPALSGSWSAFVAWVRHSLTIKTWLPAMALLVLLIFPQAWFYKQQTGHWWVYAYGEEKFHFDKPHFWQVLAGFRVGLLIYSPMIILAVMGLVRLIRQYRFTGIWLSVFLFGNIWLISCWWMWHYEGTFGMRPLIDHLAWWGLPLALLLQTTAKYWRQGFLVIAAFFVFVCQIQAFQRFQAIIPWSNMTFQKYKYVFLNKSRIHAHLFTDKDFPDFPEKPTGIFFKNIHDENPNSHDGILMVKETRNLEIEMPIDSVMKTGEGLHVAVNLNWWMDVPNIHARVVIETIRDGQSIDYHTRPLIENTPRAKFWNWSWTQTNLTDQTQPGDTLRVWIMHTTDSELKVDDFQLTVVPFAL